MTIWRLVFLSVFAISAPAAANVGQRPSALTALSESKMAIGGERSIAAVHALVIKGSIQQGFNAVTGKLVMDQLPLEIRIILPDNYLRIVTMRSMVMRDGFVGKKSLTEWRPTSAVSSFQTHFGPDAVKLARAEFERLMLGMILFAPRNVACGQKADHAEIHCEGGGTVNVDLDLDPVTRILSAIRYKDALRFPSAMTPEAARKGVAPLPPPTTAEVTWQFEDRRPVGGLLLPFRVRQVASDVTFWEMSFDTIEVNPRMTFADFSR